MIGPGLIEIQSQLNQNYGTPQVPDGILIGNRCLYSIYNGSSTSRECDGGEAIVPLLAPPFQEGRGSDVRVQGAETAWAHVGMDTCDE